VKLINGKITKDPMIVAEFLLSTPGISKDTLGMFLGKKEKYNQEVFEAFCRKLDFTDTDIDEALRFFLDRFKLPGEGQQIERIIETFSIVYYEDNPEPFTCNYQMLNFS
jgi:brefeldin A-inhibited guanine nucleotide-exchange protein